MSITTATRPQTTTHPDPETGELLPIIDLAEAPFEMAIRAEMVAERDRLRHRYGLANEPAVKLAHERIKSACAAIVDDEKQTLLEGGFRQTRIA